jgi:hypothetical protein
VTALSLTGVSTAAVEGFVTVEIGAERKKYQLHKALLTHHSGYFRAALKKTWREGMEGLVKLEDVDPVAFDIFVNWIYTRQLPDPKQWSEDLPDIPREGEDDNWYVTDLVKAYVFGDRFLALEFKEVVNNYIVDYILKTDEPPWFTATQYAFENLTQDHLLLQLLLDVTCRFWEVRYCDPESHHAHKCCSFEFILHLLEYYSNKVADYPEGEWWRIGLVACDYHENNSKHEPTMCQKKTRR